jgi:hypothetical protein
MMSGNAIQHKTILALLIAGPECIAALFSAGGEWNVTEVLVHLRSGAYVRGGCIEDSLAAKNTTQHAFNLVTGLREPI